MTDHTLSKEFINTLDQEQREVSEKLVHWIWCDPKSKMGHPRNWFSDTSTYVADSIIRAVLDIRRLKRRPGLTQLTADTANGLHNLVIVIAGRKDDPESSLNDFCRFVGSNWNDLVSSLQALYLELESRQKTDNDLERIS